jgi:release factor glutamine methyltransferase
VSDALNERPVSYQDAIRQGAAKLAERGIETARLDAEVLLRHVLGIDRATLFMRYQDPIANDDLAAFSSLIERRLDGSPVAYLTGTREFMGMDFRVGPGVLVPRPETELLVEWGLEQVRGRSGLVVDVGTGSGAIAVSVAALAGDGVRVIGTDLSADALAIAENNADRLVDGPRRKMISFRQGSLLEPVTEQVDVVLANLPYLTPEQVEGNPDLAAEPRMALDGGPDGLDLVRVLVADLPRVLTDGGGVGLEIDPSQQEATERLLREQFPGREVRTIFDLAGFARHVVMDLA